MAANGMVRPCSCPASSYAGKGRQRQGARYVFETQHRNHWLCAAAMVLMLGFSPINVLV
jgi:hypothetical protein